MYTHLTHLFSSGRESESVFGSKGLNCKTFLKYSGQFCLIWMIANYSYVVALGKIDAADVTAMFSSCSAFVYVLSWLLLDERVSIIRVSTILRCHTGYMQHPIFLKGSYVGYCCSTSCNPKLVIWYLTYILMGPNLDLTLRRIIISYS